MIPKLQYEIEPREASLADLLKFWNDHSGQKPIKKFKSEEDARKRVTELRLAIIDLNGPSSKPAGKKAAAKAAAAKDGTEPKGQGRSSKHAGKFIKRGIDKDTKKPIANPRREGTHGHRSFELVPANEKGIVYEDYISKGGRNNDLSWDLERGYLTVG